MIESSIWFNEIEPYACQWLANLFPSSQIDKRSITDLTGDHLPPAGRCHFFAGIGGWEYALQLAGWPQDRPVWTGSCPCQPFSLAGKRKGFDDERHLWPEFKRLIAECRPATVFGEQVASKGGREWLAGVRNDLEALGYAVGAADLCGPCVGAPHVRQRLYWVASVGVEHPDHAGLQGRVIGGDGSGQRTVGETSLVGGLAYNVCVGSHAAITTSGAYEGVPGNALPADGEGSGGLANSEDVREHGTTSDTVETGQEHYRKPDGNGPPTHYWGRCQYIPCRDGKERAIGPGSFPLAHGFPPRVGSRESGIPRVVRDAASRNRTGRLKGYGNAIIPQLAALFIRSFLETEKT